MVKNDEIWNSTLPIYGSDKKNLQQELDWMVFVKDKGLDKNNSKVEHIYKKVKH